MTISGFGVRHIAAALVTTACIAGATLHAQRAGRPARDATVPAATPGTGSIAGVVRALDSGRPVRRARVMVSTGGQPGGRVATTGDDGAFELKELAAGRYTVRVSKPGFVTLSYGQKRPRQPAVPLQLREGEQLTSLEMWLPRGGVISGHVLDDQGAPLVAALVQVQRYEYRQGERRLVPEGTGRTDDRGEYRVYGLPPGDYYVSATPPREGLPVGPRGTFGPGRAPGGRGFGGPVRPGLMVRPDDGGADEESTDFAPTYYPGVGTPTETGRVALALGQELTNVDFGLQLVPTARVSGTVLAPEGGTLRFASVALMAEGGFPVFGRQLARVGTEGTFTLTGVPPGSYRAIVRGQVEGIDGPLVSSVPVTVAGSNVTGLSIALRAGPDVSGTISFEGGSPAAGELSNMAVVLRSADSSMGPVQLAMGRVDDDFRFTVSNVFPGQNVVQLQRAPRGWTIKEARLGPREVTDVPFEVKPDGPLGTLNVVLTNALSSLGGTVRNAKGDPASDFTAILFPADSSEWHPLSRRIAAKRADQFGQYEFQNLITGRYLLAAIDVVEEGEWTDPAFLERIRPRAVAIQIDGGGRVTRDLTGVATP